ncbi:FAD-dependent oxidoreductase [soil metagenome]
MSGRLVIVGGGPAGLSAARAYRNSGGEGEVVILAAEEFPPYERPPLTKEFLRGESGMGDLPIEEEGFYRDNGIEVRLSTEVEALGSERRVARLKSGEEISYESCVLATGSRPIRIPVPGADDPEILLMRTINDSTRLTEKVDGRTRVAVVGSGFIGCEAAASLAMRGAEVSVVSMEEAPQKERLGGEVGERISAWLAEYGVDLRMNSVVEAIERGGEGFQVRMEGGDGGILADAVLFATGVEPRIELAEEAGLEIESGAVATDSSMRTSEPSIFAAGDIAFAYNESAGRRLRVEHWGDALEHGRIAGANAAGGGERLTLAPGFWSAIGEKTVKYWAWGDGWDESKFVEHENGAFTVWYGRGGIVVGVLSHDADEDYRRGKDLVEAGASMPR